MSTIRKIEDFINVEWNKLLLQSNWNEFINNLKNKFKNDVSNVLVLWNILNRLLIVETKDNKKIFFSVNKPLYSDTYIINENDSIELESEDSTISYGTIGNSKLKEANFPKTYLVSLYIKENFPLPRFSLWISDIAWKIRKDYLWEVILNDMQLDDNINNIVNDIKINIPDIIWISVTFWQQKLLEELLDILSNTLEDNHLIVIWWSLPARNYQYILSEYPNVIIGLSYWETTMLDLCKYKRWEISLTSVRDIAYNDKWNIIEQRWSLKKYWDSIPELDLLSWILEKWWIMNFETSRWCSFKCSFCPRDHKWLWDGETSKYLDEYLPILSELYSHENIEKRRLYVIDEEFLWYKKNSLLRWQELSNIFNKYDFKYESSSRIDQVYNSKKTDDWHIERIKFWKDISSKSLGRMLFGVESWVNSILDRFNKRILKEQSIYALRILSICNIPIRITYITA